MNFKKKLILFLTVTICVLPATALDSVNNDVLLNKAEKAFSTGNELLETNPDDAAGAYRAAAEYYDSIIDSGTRNAELYYNLANAYFRLDKLGYAVLNYRRAQLYDPSDKNTAFNLDYARSIQKNNFSSNTENEVLRILLFWHYLVPVFWKFIIFASANIVFWSALVLRRFGRSTGTAPVITALVVVLMFGTSFFVDIGSSGGLHGVVTAESTTGRLGDSRSYEPVFDAPLYQGVEFTIEQRRAGWLLAKLPGGEYAWIEESDCGIVEEGID